MWVLRELNFNFDVIRLRPFIEGKLNPDIVKLNPDGKVPILVHNDKVLLESLAIMEYLNGISPNGTLVPSDVDENFEFRRKLHYGLTEIEPYLWLAEQANGPLSSLFNWPEGVYQESIDSVAKSCKAVDGFLCARYLLDSGFSIADIYFYHILTWAKQHGVALSARIDVYLSELENRASFPEEMSG